MSRSLAWPPCHPSKSAVALLMPGSFLLLEPPLLSQLPSSLLPLLPWLILLPHSPSSLDPSSSWLPLLLASPSHPSLFSFLPSFLSLFGSSFSLTSPPSLTPP